MYLLLGILGQRRLRIILDQSEQGLGEGEGMRLEVGYMELVI